MGLFSFFSKGTSQDSLGCPRQHGALARQDVLDVRMYHCAECDGRWLPGAQLPAFFKHLSDPAQAAREFRQLLDQQGQDSSARCAQDGAAMRFITQRGVTLDVCTQCHGVWFDGGELNQMMVAGPASGPADAVAGEAPAASGAAAAAGTATVAVAAAEVAAGLFDIFS